MPPPDEIEVDIALAGRRLLYVTLGMLLFVSLPAMVVRDFFTVGPPAAGGRRDHPAHVRWP